MPKNKGGIIIIAMYFDYLLCPGTVLSLFLKLTHLLFFLKALLDRIIRSKYKANVADGLSNLTMITKLESRA